MLPVVPDKESVSFSSYESTMTDAYNVQNARSDWSGMPKYLWWFVNLYSNLVIIKHDA